jgi:hypothetical protein
MGLDDVEDVAGSLINASSRRGSKYDLAVAGPSSNGCEFAWGGCGCLDW